MTIPVTLGEEYYIEVAAAYYYNESTETIELLGETTFGDNYITFFPTIYLNTN